MTLQEWLQNNQKQLEGVGITTARLDCLVLLEDALGKDRTLLLAHPEIELTSEQEFTLNEQITERLNHIPLAYIRGKSDFYGRTFVVNHNVLEPRPESETIIDLLKGLNPGSGAVIADIGTGSGALAITAKLEYPEANVYGVDIDPECLEVAKTNAVHLGAQVTFLESDLLSGLTTSGSTPFALLCNLPYVPNTFQINPAAMNEPRLAIFGGYDGLDLYRKMFSQIVSTQWYPHFLLTESLPPQHEQLAELAQVKGYKQKLEEDFIQLFERA